MKAYEQCSCGRTIGHRIWWMKYINCVPAGVMVSLSTVKSWKFARYPWMKNCSNNFKRWSYGVVTFIFSFLVKGIRRNTKSENTFFSTEKSTTKSWLSICLYYDTGLSLLGASQVPRRIKTWAWDKNLLCIAELSRMIHIL